MASSESGPSEEVKTQPEGSNKSEQNKEQQPLSQLEKDIIGQVEYYFSDSYLQRHPFLSQFVRQDGGWVTMKVMSLFNRLKRLSTDSTLITKALQRGSELMEVSEDGSKIRRSPNKPFLYKEEERTGPVILKITGPKLEINKSQIADALKKLDEEVTEIFVYPFRFGGTECLLKCTGGGGGKKLLEGIKALKEEGLQIAGQALKVCIIGQAKK